MPIIKNIIKLTTDAGKGNPYLLMMGVETGTTTMEINVAVFQETKDRTSTWSSSPIPVSYDRDICTSMFMKALFTTANKWNHIRHPSNERWKIKVIHRHVGILFTCLKNEIYRKIAEKYTVLRKITWT